jgi:hypothetical protein
MEKARVKLENIIVKIMLAYKKRVRERVRGIDKTISNRTNIESRRMLASRMSVSIVYWRMASYKG